MESRPKGWTWNTYCIFKQTSSQAALQLPIEYIYVLYRKFSIDFNLIYWKGTRSISCWMESSSKGWTWNAILKQTYHQAALQLPIEYICFVQKTLHSLQSLLWRCSLRHVDWKAVIMEIMMVVKIDGNSEHVAHVWWKTSLSIGEYCRSKHMPFSELPSNMQAIFFFRTQKGIRCCNVSWDFFYWIKFSSW